MKEIAVVLVNYNGANVMNECLETLKQQTLQNFDVIIVDNGSIDDSIIRAKETYDDLIVIETHVNNGVAKGNNIGIDYARKHNYKYVILLNNDTVVHEKLIETLFLKSNGIYVTVPKMYFYHRRQKDLIWYAGGSIDFNRGNNNHWGVGENDSGQYNCEKKIMYAPTCCMLIPMNVFSKIGMMDENYFMYFDDTDFCMRLGINKIDILYIPDAVLWHKVSSTAGINSPLSVYYLNRNRFYFLKKFKDYFPARAIVYTYATVVVRYILSFLNKSNNRYIKKAYFDYAKNAMGYRQI